MALVAEALGPVPFGAGDWERLPGVVEELLADPAPAERVAVQLEGVDELACVGRGYLMCVALEAALKLREAAGRARRRLVRRGLPPRTADGLGPRPSHAGRERRGTGGRRRGGARRAARRRGWRRSCP